MISVIRRGLNKKSLRVVVWILLLALFGLPSILSIFKRFSEPALQSVAMVNGQPIDFADFKQKVAEEERRLQFFKQFGVQAEDLLRSLGISGNAQEMALQALIQEALIDGAAHDLNIRLSDEYIAQKMQDPAFLLQSLSSVIPPSLFGETGTLDFQVLVRYLQRQGISMQAFEKMVEQALYKDSVFKLVQGAVYIPEQKLIEAYTQEYSNKKYVLVSFSRAQALQTVKKTVPTDEQLTQFFTTQNTQARRYWVPEKRNITVWTFTPSAYGIAATDKEVKSHYAKNRDAYKGKDLAAATPAIKELLLQEKFKRLFNLDAQRVIAGSAHDQAIFENFVQNKKAQVARKTIENTMTPLARKAFSSAAAKKGFLLDGKDGLIIQVENIEKSYLPSFDQVKATVLRDYYDAKAQELLQNQLLQLKDAQNGAKEEMTGWINPQKPESFESLKSKGLPVTRMLRMTHVGDFIDAFTDEYAYAIRLAEVEQVNREDLASKKDDLLKALTGQNAQLISQAFVASLQKNATIVINKTV